MNRFYVTFLVIWLDFQQRILSIKKIKIKVMKIHDHLNINLSYLEVYRSKKWNQGKNTLVCVSISH